MANRVVVRRFVAGSDWMFAPDEQDDIRAIVRQEVEDLAAANGWTLSGKVRERTQYDELMGGVLLTAVGIAD